MYNIYTLPENHSTDLHESRNLLQGLTQNMKKITS